MSDETRLYQSRTIWKLEAERDRYRDALARIVWNNECLVCGAFTITQPGYGYTLDHKETCAWAEAVQAVKELDT